MIGVVRDKAAAGRIRAIVSDAGHVTSRTGIPIIVCY